MFDLHDWYGFLLEILNKFFFILYPHAPMIVPNSGRFPFVCFNIGEGKDFEDQRATLELCEITGRRDTKDLAYEVSWEKSCFSLLKS